MPPIPSLFSPYFRRNIVTPKITNPLIQLLLTVSFSLFKLFPLKFSLPYQEDEMT